MNTGGRRLDNVYLVAFARTAFTRFSRRSPRETTSGTCAPRTSRRRL